jgi:hypothetical protein
MQETPLFNRLIATLGVVLLLVLVVLAATGQIVTFGALGRELITGLMSMVVFFTPATFFRDLAATAAGGEAPRPCSERTIGPMLTAWCGELRKKPIRRTIHG